MTEKMKRIASFEVDHNKLQKGMYISRADGDIITYDIRTHLPNGGRYMPCAAAHSFEHLFATLARNSRFEENIVYVGPMGCRTGFYLVVRGMSHAEALELMRDILHNMALWQGKIPGVSKKECGNYRSHSLAGAQAVAADMEAVLKDWTVEKMYYDAH